MTRQGERLVCAWHGAEFRCSDGACVQGLARPDSALVTLPTRVEDGVLACVYGK